MSVAGHEKAAATQKRIAEQHAAEYDADAVQKRERCRPSLGGAMGGTDICWTSVTNPTDVHLQQAEDHRRQAADHRAAAAALREAEGRACVGVSPGDRDASPFAHTEDIAGVQPLNDAAGETPDGAIVIFRAVRGMTAELLQRVVNCHLARNASLGHVVPEMPDCPLVPHGVDAKVRAVEGGFAVEMRSDDPATAKEILTRSRRLVATTSQTTPDPARSKGAGKK